MKVLTGEIKDVSKIPNPFLNKHLARHRAFYSRKRGKDTRLCLQTRPTTLAPSISSPNVHGAVLKFTVTLPLQN